MADGAMRPVAAVLALLNFCLYVIVAALAGWALNHAIHHTFVVDTGLVLPAHFSPIFFPMGNGATGFFVVFALIASVVGAGSVLAGLNHVRHWGPESMPAAVSVATVAWTLTLLAMGLACKEIKLSGRNAKLRTMEALLIILSATQLLYILALLAGSAMKLRPTPRV